MNTERDLVVTLAAAEPDLLARATTLHAELTVGCLSPQRELLRKLGEVLFQIAFPTRAAIQELAARLAVAASAPGTKPLRLWLHVAQPELALWPWEYLCLTPLAVTACRNAGDNIQKYEANGTNPTVESFLALHPNVSLVRAASAAPRGHRLDRLGKLRVLIAWANPGPTPDGGGWPRIDGIAREVEAIVRALGSVGSTLVEWRVLERADRAAFEKIMTDWQPHVVHFAGHGALPGRAAQDDDVPAPALVLERNGKAATPTRRHDYLLAAELARWCAAAGTLVVVLNSCWGAASGPNFPGIAQVLAGGVPEQSGVPVVVAHQFPILQTSAVGFPLPFYDNLCRATSVEEAVDTYRQDLIRDSLYGHFDPGWGVPVVFLGVQDSQLFRTIEADPFPSHFRWLLEQYANQVPRPFLDRQVDDFLARETSGIFHLVAAPGTGKTGFLARRIEADRSAVHFFYRRTAAVTNPDECINAIYDGLCGRYGFVEADDPLAQRRRRLDKLLEHVSAACQQRGGKEVVVIDALDEASRSPWDNQSAFEVLPARLPPHVYFLVSSRPGPEAEELGHRKDVEQYVLDQNEPELQHDLAVYTRRELVGKVAEAADADLEALGDVLAARTRANFLVLKNFLYRVLAGGAVSRSTIEREATRLTDSVEEEYGRWFSRLSTTLGDRELMATMTLLAAFAYAHGPITEDMVCDAFDLSSALWAIGFRSVCQFLERGGIRQAERGTQTYRFYHQTFQEYLEKRELKKRDRREARQRWATYCLEWRKLEGYPRLYALRRLPRHLLQASQEG